MGVKRIIVEDEIADEFAGKLVSQTEKLVMGNPLDKTTTLGTLISEKAAVHVEETVNNAVSCGAEILTGGKREGAFYQATVIDNVTHDMDLVVRETFGPVAPIIRVSSVEEATMNSAGDLVGIFDFKQIFKRTIDSGEVLSDNSVTLLAIGLLNGFLDLFNRFVLRQHAGDGEEAGLHDCVDAV